MITPAPSIPSSLIKVMRETVSKTVPSLYSYVGNDAVKLKEIFKTRIFNPNYDGDVLEGTQLSMDSLLGKEIKFLHNLYLNPDKTGGVSKIDDDEIILKDFRNKMVEVYKACKATELNRPVSKSVEEKPQPDMAVFDAPPKTNDSVEPEPNSYIAQTTHESSQIPANSKNYVIDCGMFSTLLVGSNSSNISIYGDYKSKITIEKGCKNIKISLGMKSTVKVGDFCTDIKITGYVEDGYTIGSHCERVYVKDAQIY